MNHFNGKHVCLYCYIKNEKHEYPLRKDLKELRIDEELLADMKTAKETRNTVRGVKGISSLSLLAKLSLTKRVVVEAMHDIYIGIVQNQII